MLRFASHPLADGEVAVLFTQGNDMLVILNSTITDPQRRCEAVNRLLARLPLSLSAAVAA